MTLSPTGDDSPGARLHRRERELRAIRKITAALHTRTSLDELVRETLNAAVETVNASGGTVYLHDPAKKVLVFKYVLGATSEITDKLTGMEMPDSIGIAGEVFQSGHGRITQRASDEETHFGEVDARTNFRTESALTVPLRSAGGTTLGVVQLQNRREGEFDEDDLHVLEILSLQAASALETARLYEEQRRAAESRLRRRERELRAIRRIRAALHARTNLDELEREALNVAIETLNASGGTIYIHDPAKKVLIFRYVVGATPEITKKLTGLEMPDDRGISGEVFHSGEGRITLKVSEDSSHNSEVDAKTQFRTESTITVPLNSMGGHTLGVMQLLNRQQGHFDEDDLEILEILSSQAASAIETARLYEEARRASVIHLIGDISHDVKNFLTPVVTGTQTLEIMVDGMFEDLDRTLVGVPEEKLAEIQWAVGGVRDFYREAVNMVYDGARDAQERVREIADAIKGIISKPHFELTDFRERVEQVAKYLKPVAERQGVLIDLTELRDSEPVEIDRKGMYNALYNLINNAIPETPEGGKITVRTQPVPLDGQPALEIQVADTGKGMPDHVRERILSGDSISTKPGGTGLGTKIVLNVVELHHGQIDIQSEPGKGTTFIIRIPMRQPGEEGPEPQ